MADTETNAPAVTDQNSGDTIQQNKIDAEVLQNIPVTISVEVGRTTLKIRDLKQQKITFLIFFLILFFQFHLP